MANGSTIADDFRTGISAVTIEIYGADTEQNRRKVYRQLSEVPPGQRLRGIFTVGRKVCCVPSIVRADLRRRAGLLASDNTATDHPASQPPG